MVSHKRQRLLIDANVQGMLVFHVVIYWLCCVVTIELLDLAWQIATGPEQPSFFAYLLNQDLWAVCGRFVVSALLLVPLIIFDTLRVSNRFAGPVFRMRQVLAKVARDGVVETVELRQGDHWHDFAADLNAALARLSDPNAQAAAAAQKDFLPFEQNVASA